MARPKTRKITYKPQKRKKRFLFFIPYPLIVFLLLCSGVYLLAWTFNASADDVIRSVIHAQPVGGQAVISSPIEGQHFTSVPISVAGTCPINAAYVEVFRNGVMGGSAPCDSGGEFQLQADLFDGANKLEVHSFNLTDDQGPVSDPVDVVYDAPQSPSASLNTSGQAQPGSSAKSPPLLLSTAFVYKGYYVGDQVSWPLSISGGSPPFALNVDWGDGQDSVISRVSAGQFDVSHTYQDPGGNGGVYTIKAQATDAQGDHSYLQFFVVVSQKAGQAAAAGGTNIYTKEPPSLSDSRKWVWAAWPAYGAVSLMIFSYWLGEREELILLRKRHLLKRL